MSSHHLSCWKYFKTARHSPIGSRIHLRKRSRTLAISINMRDFLVLLRAIRDRCKTSQSITVSHRYACRWSMNTTKHGEQMA